MPELNHVCTSVFSMFLFSSRWGDWPRDLCSANWGAAVWRDSERLTPGIGQDDLDVEDGDEYTPSRAACSRHLQLEYNLLWSCDKLYPAAFACKLVIVTVSENKPYTIYIFSRWNSCCYPLSVALPSATTDNQRKGQEVEAKQPRKY